VVKSEGSTPRHVGSKMLVYPNGIFLGTVGGGEMESRVIKSALETLQTGNAQTLSYTMADPARGDPGVCGGTVEVFVEPILPPAMIVVIGAGHVGKARTLFPWLFTGEVARIQGFHSARRADLRSGAVVRAA